MLQYNLKLGYFWLPHFLYRNCTQQNKNLKIVHAIKILWLIQHWEIK